MGRFGGLWGGPYPLLPGGDAGMIFPSVFFLGGGGHAGFVPPKTGGMGGGGLSEGDTAGVRLRGGDSWQDRRGRGVGELHVCALFLLGDIFPRRR